MNRVSGIDGSSPEHVIPDSPRRVLLVQYSSSRDGSAFSGLLLLDGLSQAGFDTHVAFGHAGPMEDEYRRQGHTTYVVEHNNWLRRGALHRFSRDVFAEFRRARTFEEIFLDLNPDVVYVNTSVSLAAVIAARRHGIPCIWHLRELYSTVGGELMAPRMFRPILPRVFLRMADALVAPSTAIADNLLGEASGQVRIIPNAVDADYFEYGISILEARSHFGLPEKGIVMGVPGTLRPMKGHSFFIRAIEPILCERSDVCIAVTGSGKPSFVSNLKQLVEDFGISSRVHFLGVVSDMRSFYRSCDLVCIPSRAEPFGRTVIEAMAIGTPLVATSVGGIVEIVDDGLTGLLVDYDDDESLRAAVSELMDDEDRRHELAERAKSVARDRYHESAYKMKIQDVVTGVLQESSEPAS